jgi:hypothetical protein
VFVIRFGIEGNFFIDGQDIPVSLSCGKCGSNDITIPDNADETTLIKCNACEAVLGTWGDIKAAAGQHVREAVEEKFKDALREGFKGSKYFRVE